MFWDAAVSKKIFQQLKSLYLILDVATLFFPVALSFDKKVHFFSRWLSVLLAALLISIPFIIWDVIFTDHGIWGFNPEYLTGIYIINLPIEEVLFFIVVPFACVFIYECCKVYFSKYRFNFLNRFVQIGILLYLASLLFLAPFGTYTITVCLTALAALVLWIGNSKFVHLGLAFILSLIPFIIMNGILTGHYTESPIVWYSELEITGYRLMSIPLEDLLYSFTLIGSNIVLFEYIQKRRLK
jgi:lycopene cyclase domain-containing protein